MLKQNSEGIGASVCYHCELSRRAGDFFPFKPHTLLRPSKHKMVETRFKTCVHVGCKLSLSDLQTKTFIRSRERGYEYIRFCQGCGSRMHYFVDVESLRKRDHEPEEEEPLQATEDGKDRRDADLDLKVGTRSLHQETGRMTLPKKRC